MPSVSLASNKDATTPQRTVMNTTKQRLCFFNSKKTEMQTVQTKAQGRNADGVMTYETPQQTWSRIIDKNLVDFRKYSFTHVDTNC